jgi:translation initiation factor 2 subunit 3
MEELPELNVGVVGHIDHGKTTLLSKLTGKFADTHSEELKRGITIKLGYAQTIIYQDGNNYNNEKKGKPIRYISFIDAPGHEMLMATMLSGAASFDAAILVVAANEGYKTSNKRTFYGSSSKKLKNIIVVQNKIDLSNKRTAIENYKKIKNSFLEHCGKFSNYTRISSTRNKH